MLIQPSSNSSFKIFLNKCLLNRSDLIWEMIFITYLSNNIHDEIARNNFHIIFLFSTQISYSWCNNILYKSTVTSRHSWFKSVLSSILLPIISSQISSRKWDKECHYIWVVQDYSRHQSPIPAAPTPCPPVPMILIHCATDRLQSIKIYALLSKLICSGELSVTGGLTSTELWTIKCQQLCAP